MQKKNKINKYNKDARLQLETCRKTVLANGLRLLSERVDSVESFALGINIRVGSVNDPDGLQGMAHFTEHAVFRRTRNLNFRQIAAQFESLGAYFNAFTTKEYTSFYVRAMKRHFDKTLRLLMDIVFNPIFLPEDIEKERSIIFEEIRSTDDDPEEMVFDKADSLLLGNHPLSRPIMGSIDTVGKISIDDIKQFHSKYYVPTNVIISAAGNLSHEKLVNIASSFDVQYSPAPGPNIFPMPNMQTGLVETSHPSQQLHYVRGRLIEGLMSADRFPLAVLNVLFGEGMSSRLNQQLRERYGIAYNIFSANQLYTDVGTFYVYAGTEEKKSKKLTRLLDIEFNKLLEKRIPNTEISRAREQLKTSILMDLESMSSRMEAMAKSEFLRGRFEDIASTIAMIDAVGQEDIKNIIEKYFADGLWVEIVQRGS